MYYLIPNTNNPHILVRPDTMNRLLRFAQLPQLRLLVLSDLLLIAQSVLLVRSVLSDLLVTARSDQFGRSVQLVPWAQFDPSYPLRR